MDAPLAPRIGLVLPDGDRLGRIAVQVVRELREAPTVDLVGVGSLEVAQRCGAGRLQARGANDPRLLSEPLRQARGDGAWLVLAPAPGRTGIEAAGEWIEEGVLDGCLSLEAPPDGPRLRLRAACEVVELFPGLPLPALEGALADPALPALLGRAAALLRTLGVRAPLTAFDCRGLPVRRLCEAARAAGVSLRGPLPAAEAVGAGGPLVAWTEAQAELPLALAGSGPEIRLDLAAPLAWPVEPEPAAAVLAVQRLGQAAAVRRPLAAEREAARRPAVSVARSARAVGEGASDRCPYCHRALSEGADGAALRAGAPVRCVGCGTAHHRDCLAEHGRCTVLGCRGGEVVRLGVRLPYEGLGLEEPMERPFDALQGHPDLGPRWLRMEAPHDDLRRAPLRRGLAIELGDPRPARGAVVEGFLVVHAPRPFRVRGGALRLRATLTTRPLRGSAAPRTSVILDRRAPFLGEGPATPFGRLQDEVLALFAGQGGTTLPAGVRRYPFSFLLDPEHPATVRNRYAEVDESVVTTLEAVLDRETARAEVEVR